MSNEIIKILDDLGRRFGVAVDWSNQNVMPYLEELMKRFIQWEISTSIVWMFIGVVFSIVGIISLIHIWKKRANYKYFGDPDEFITWGFILSIVAAVVGVCVLLTQCLDICKAVYLPELRVYEYIQHLMSCSVH